LYCLAIRTVKPRCLTPRYLAKLAARHVNVKDGFLAMYFTSISRHPHLSPSPQLGWVSPGVIWPWYVATIGPAAAVQAHKASLLADQRIQPAVLVSVTVMTSLVPSSCTVSMLPPRPIAQRGSAILWLCSEQNVMAGKKRLPLSMLPLIVNCQRVTHWPTARLSTWWAHPARRVPRAVTRTRRKRKTTTACCRMSTYHLVWPSALLTHWCATLSSVS